MTRIETSRWPAALFAGLAVVLLSSGASAKDIKSKTVNCNLPGQTLANALSNTSSDAVDEIVFTGPCIEDLTITKDDVKLRGADATDEIQGQINIDGAHRVSLRDFTLDAGARDSGVNAFDGAAIRIDTVDISGAAESNIFVQRNAFAEVRDSTIHTTGEVNIRLENGASLEIRDSVIADADNTGIWVRNGSSARIIDTSVTGSGQISVAVYQGSAAFLRGNIFNMVMEVKEGSFARIQSSMLHDDDEVALRLTHGGTARLIKGESVLTSGTLNVIAIDDHSSLHQWPGVVLGSARDTITGIINVSHDSSARFRDANINGDIIVKYHSGLRLGGKLPGVEPTLVGSVIIGMDSYADLRGDSPLVITGSVSCYDNESSVQLTNVTVTLGVSCTGFNHP